MAAPAVVLLGWTLKTSCVGVPTATLNAVLVAGVTPVAAAASVYPVPTLLMRRLASVATPLTAVTVVVPDNAPPLGFAPSATVTFPVKVGSVLPSASSAVTWTAGVIAAPAVTALG